MQKSLKDKIQHTFIHDKFKIQETRKRRKFPQAFDKIQCTFMINLKFRKQEKKRKFPQAFDTHS